MIHKIKRWWRWEARFLFRDIQYGIKNLIRWFPIIWKDRDWDQAYIWDILERKLRNQSYHIKHYGHHVNIEQDSRNLLICAKLIKKIRDEDYVMEYIDYFSRDISFVPSEYTMGYEMTSTINLEKFDEFFKQYPRIYKKITIDGEPMGIEDKQRVAMNIAQINHQRAIRLLFKIMEEHIERWWD